MQWPASYCDTKRSCCYPKTGKPAEDFSIHGLWPNRDDGTWPQFCDRDISFDESEVYIYIYIYIKFNHLKLSFSPYLIYVYIGFGSYPKNAETLAITSMSEQ